MYSDGPVLGRVPSQPWPPLSGDSGDGLDSGRRCSTQPTRRHVLLGRATATLHAAASRQRLVEQSLGITGSNLIVSPAIRYRNVT
jgi:hypothetical protein